MGRHPAHWTNILGLIFCCLAFGGCQSTKPGEPTIIFTKIPPAREGGPDQTATIAGQVADARPGQKIVLYAKSGVWWVQPLVEQPFTDIQSDGSWKADIHFGTEYAALLVEPDYVPPAKTDSLPKVGRQIAVVSQIDGEKSAVNPSPTLSFSGYEWQIRTVSSDRGATKNEFDPANAWTDSNGFLHLKIARNKAGEWTCAEVKLTRSLGYGTYNFVVQEVSHLEPAAVFSMFTWDDLEGDQNHRELDIEVTRWGDPANKPMQFVVQPYYVPVNVARFDAPSGPAVYSFHWEPGRAGFKVVRGKKNAGRERPAAEHSFTSGVPSPESETVHLNLYIFGYGMTHLEKETEIIIEKFEFLP